MQQHAQERARLTFKRESLLREVANLSRELEVRSCELEQLDSDSAAVTSLTNSTAQEISHLQEKKQALLRCAVDLKEMIEDSLDRF
ncbi:hypothetical protein AMTR_s00200p00030710 [Amborella trichopoda]|uniref:Uncharacterized protein n=1 Tax=Amborella trichopoda TaxID=13333 RepID=W1NNU2_AMBTC|nr:hypothetical protein AMTR_s00200p00030710 [Amborella trichopoda]